MIDELQKELRSDQEKVIKDLFLHCVVLHNLTPTIASKISKKNSGAATI